VVALIDGRERWLKQILLGLIMIIGLIVLFFGGGLPSSFNEVRSGNFKLEFKPLINIGPMFEGVNLGSAPRN
jgi:hypothetical protein